MNEDAAQQAASFTGAQKGRAQGGSSTIGRDMRRPKMRYPKLDLSKRKEEPKKAPEKKPAQKPAQKALPAGKERKALPPSPQKKSIAGGSSSIVKRTSSSLARSA